MKPHYNTPHYIFQRSIYEIHHHRALNSLSSTTDMLILDPLVIILVYIYAFKTYKCFRLQPKVL